MLFLAIPRLISQKFFFVRIRRKFLLIFTELKLNIQLTSSFDFGHILFDYLVLANNISSTMLCSNFAKRAQRGYRGPWGKKEKCGSPASEAGRIFIKHFRTISCRNFDTLNGWQLSEKRPNSLMSSLIGGPEPPPPHTHMISATEADVEFGGKK